MKGEVPNARQNLKPEKNAAKQEYLVTWLRRESKTNHRSGKEELLFRLRSGVKSPSQGSKPDRNFTAYKLSFLRMLDFSGYDSV